MHCHHNQALSVLAALTMKPPSDSTEAALLKERLPELQQYIFEELRPLAKIDYAPFLGATSP
jgi:hypothetical protein